MAYAGRHPDFYARPEEPGELVGYAVDIARIAASALNFTVEFEYQVRFQIKLLGKCHYFVTDGGLGHLE